MGTVVLDASVIIAFLTPSDAHHERSCELLQSWLGAEEDNLVLPASAYSEVLVHAVREGRPEYIDTFLDEAGMRVMPIGRTLARRAAELRAQTRSLRLPDALVLAAALDNGAVLLTVDDQMQRLAEQNR